MQRRGVGVNITKFQVPQDPLEHEERLKVITPDVLIPADAEQRKRMISILDEMMQSGRLTDSEEKALEFQKMQLTTWELKQAVNYEFTADFWRWLLGRGKKSDHDKTLWGIQSLADDPEVYAYVGSLVAKMHGFRVKLELLRRRRPVGIKQCYLYFKYIVRGLNDKQDVNQASFLDDWDIMVREFEDARKEGQDWIAPGRPVPALKATGEVAHAPHETAPYDDLRAGSYAKNVKHTASRLLAGAGFEGPDGGPGPRKGGRRGGGGGRNDAADDDEAGDDDPGPPRGRGPAPPPVAPPDIADGGQGRRTFEMLQADLAQRRAAEEQFRNEQRAHMARLENYAQTANQVARVPLPQKDQAEYNDTQRRLRESETRLAQYDATLKAQELAHQQRLRAMQEQHERSIRDLKDILNRPVPQPLPAPSTPAQPDTRLAEALDRHNEGLGDIRSRIEQLGENIKAGAGNPQDQANEGRLLEGILREQRETLKEIVAVRPNVQAQLQAQDAERARQHAAATAELNEASRNFARFLDNFQKSQAQARAQQAAENERLRKEMQDAIDTMRNAQRPGGALPAPPAPAAAAPDLPLAPPPPPKAAGILRKELAPHVPVDSSGPTIEVMEDTERKEAKKAAAIARFKTIGASAPAPLLTAAQEASSDVRAMDADADDVRNRLVSNAILWKNAHESQQQAEAHWIVGSQAPNFDPDSAGARQLRSFVDRQNQIVRTQEGVVARNVFEQQQTNKSTEKNIRRAQKRIEGAQREVRQLEAFSQIPAQVVAALPAPTPVPALPPKDKEEAEPVKRTAEQIAPDEPALERAREQVQGIQTMYEKFSPEDAAVVGEKAVQVVQGLVEKSNFEATENHVPGVQVIAPPQTPEEVPRALEIVTENLVAIEQARVAEAEAEKGEEAKKKKTE